jgi:hypothetical protein
MTATITHIRRTWLLVLGLVLSLAIVASAVVGARIAKDSDNSPAPRVVNGTSAQVTPTNFACSRMPFSKC